jgi:hypothetical protein
MSMSIPGTLLEAIRTPEEGYKYLCAGVIEKGYEDEGGTFFRSLEGQYWIELMGMDPEYLYRVDEKS